MAIIQARPSALETLPQTLLQILVNKQQLDLAKEDQKLRQADFKLKTEAFQFEKQEREEKRAGAVASIQQLFQGARGGSGQAQEVMQRLGFTGENAGNANFPFEQLIQTQGQRAAPNVASPLERTQEEVRLERLRKSVIDRAGARGENLGLSLAAGELGATVTQQDALADPARAAATLLSTNITNRLNAANAGLAEERLRRPDTQALSNARAIWEDGAPNGVTWGQALAETGLSPIEGGVDPQSVFTDPAAKASANAEATKQAGFFVQMTDANNEINRLVELTGGITKLASFRRAITPDGLISQGEAMILNAFLSPEQQSLIQAQLNFSNLYRFSLSGQQSSAVEAVRMQVVIAEEFKDSDQVKAAKRRTREIMIDVTRMRAEGAISRTQGIDIIIARSSGLPADALVVLRAQRADAVLADAVEAGGGQVFTNASSLPSTPETIVDDIAILDDAILQLQQRTPRP